MKDANKQGEKKMASVYDEDNFIGRVNYAAACLVRNTGIGSRHFDTCFEMNDGDAVVTALVRRARKNPKLRAALPLGLNVDSIEARAAKYESIPTRKLSDLARELRNPVIK